MPTVSAWLLSDEKNELDNVAELLSKGHSTTIREGLTEGLETIRLRVAVEQHQSGDLSTTEAARLADLSIAAWLDVARERNLTTQFELSDLKLDADTAAEL